MNGKSEEELIERILTQIEQGALRQQQEIEELMSCLLECVRELSRLRKQAPVAAGERSANAIMGTSESRARRVLTPHLLDVTDAQREKFLAGDLDPNGLRLGASCGRLQMGSSG